jgi:hypothetical protein
MIQQILVVLLVIVILIQIGVLRFDTVSSLLQDTGYESDNDIEVYQRARRKSKNRRKSKRKDPNLTPIGDVIGAIPTDPDDPEEIQRAIMNELNQHDALFLTPSPI